jgi:hypothetical protein
VKHPAGIFMALFALLAGTLLLLCTVPWLQNKPVRAPINSCINNLRVIYGATQQWAADHQKDTNAVPTWGDLEPYLKMKLKCQAGGVYTLGSPGRPPTCSIPKHQIPEN